MNDASSQGAYRKQSKKHAGPMDALKKSLLVLPLLTASAAPWAVELNGRVAVAGVSSFAEAGDVGYEAGGENDHASDVQSLRLLASDTPTESTQWHLHYQLVRRASDTPGSVPHYSALFRADPLRGELAGDAAASTYLYHEADWLNLRSRFTHGQLTVGRQPLTWGSGRIWQPLDIFGAFAPLELDTEYKPGIDAVLYEHFPSPFASLSAAYVQTPLNGTADPGYALHYRRHVGAASELSVLIARVMDYRLLGGGVEGSVGGAGLRLEGVALDGPEDSDGAIAIAGVDYRFANGVLLVAELYHNGFAAARPQEFAAALALPAYPAILTPHLGRHLAGLSLSHELTPLLRAGYSLLHSQVSGAASQLHQFTLGYSIADEADAQLAWTQGSGIGLDALGNPRSDFGHLPRSLYLRVQFYF